MRIIQAIILLAFLGAVGLFAVQNTEAITVTFWTWKANWAGGFAGDRGLLAGNGERLDGGVIFHQIASPGL